MLATLAILATAALTAMLTWGLAVAAAKLLSGLLALATRQWASKPLAAARPGIDSQDDLQRLLDQILEMVPPTQRPC